MRLLKSDLIALGSSAIVITIFSFLLYDSFNKKVEVKNIKKIGNITFKKEVAQRKYQSQVVWEEVEQNVPVYDNDSIRTSGRSEAVIHLNDGTDINIEEDSMIMLSSVDNGININFEHGAISANRSAVTGSNVSAINIKSNDSTVSIDKSNIQLAQLGNGDLDLTVSEGSARVKSASQEEIQVNLNEKAIFSSDSREAKVVKLNFNLTEPTNNQYMLAESQKTLVYFAWTLVEQRKDVTLQISKDRSFNDILLDRKKIKGTSFRENLDPGVYYWRVYAVNNDNKQIEYSPISKFNIVQGKTVKPISPGNNETIEMVSESSLVTFKWTKDDMVDNYLLELSDDADFKSIKKTISTNFRTISLNDILPGRYYWRIKTDVILGASKFPRVSPSSSFSIKEITQVEPPAILESSAKIKIDTLLIKNQGVILSWTNNPAILKYEVEIAKDRDFKNIISTNPSTVNYINLKRDFPVGEYYWRVKGFSDLPMKAPWSGTGLLEIESGIELGLLSPIGGKNYELVDKSSKIDVEFEWTKVKNWRSYKIQISKNKNFTQSNNIKKTNSPSAIIPFSEAGTYFWRVAMLDDNGKEIFVSQPDSFNISLKESIVIKKKSFLTVQSPIKRSRIYINSKFKGYDQYNFEINKSGKVQVKVTARGFKDFIRTVNVKEGENLTVKSVMIWRDSTYDVKWIKRAGSPISAAPVYYNDRTISSTKNGEIIVASSSGRTIFSKKFSKRFESRPVVHNDNIYVTGVEGFLFSINMKSGKVNWKIDTGGPLLFKSEPAVIDKRIFLATAYGDVLAYDMNGKKIWNNKLDEDVYSSVQYYDNRVLVATDALKVYALNAEDGTEYWSQDIDGRVIALSPQVFENVLFFGCYSGKFYALDVQDGDTIWTFQTGGSIYSTPLINEGTIFFGSDDGNVYALSLSKGELLWKFSTGRPLKGSPIFAFGNVFITDRDTIYALNPQKGSLKWKKRFKDNIETSPAFAGDVLIFGLFNGDVVSVKNNFL